MNYYLKNTNYLYQLDKKRFNICITLIILVSLMSVVIDPLLIKNIIDAGIGAHSVNIFIILTAMLIVNNVIRLGISYALNLHQENLVNAVSDKILRKTVDSYFNSKKNNYNEGYYLSRVYDEPRELSDDYIPILLNTFKSLIKFIAGFVVTIYLAWRVTLILILVVPFLYYLSSKHKKRIKSYVNSENEEQANLRNFMNKLLASFKTVNTYRLHKVIKEKLDFRLDNYFAKSYSTNKSISYFGFISRLTMSFLEASVLIILAVIVFVNYITIGSLISYMNVFSRIIGSFSTLSGNVPSVIKYNNYIDRINEIFKSDENLEDNGCDYTGTLVLDNIKFSYPKGSTVINSLSVSIHEGESIFLYGSNGSGKTTLANIIAGYLKIDDGNIKKPDLYNISTLIEPYNFIPGKVKEHKPQKVKEHEFKKMLKKYGLIDKYNKDILELSYGQKKKVYLIMALLKKNIKMCILDEPLKGIDNKSKKLIFNDIMNLTNNSILIYISHDFKMKSYFTKSLSIDNKNIITFDIA